MGSRIYKLTLLGEGAVGKTALRHRYLGDGFKESYNMTIGADFAAKRDTIDDEDVTAQIWDLAGQGRFESVRAMYYKGAVGMLLVFDITRPDTYDAIPNWIEEAVNSNNDRIVPMVLIGNKGDLRGEYDNEVAPEDARQYAKMLSDWSGYSVPYIETSALNGENVDMAFQELLRNVGEFIESHRKKR